jgi:hypothetical protein
MTRRALMGGLGARGGMEGGKGGANGFACDGDFRGLDGVVDASGEAGVLDGADGDGVFNTSLDPKARTFGTGRRRLFSAMTRCRSGDHAASYVGASGGNAQAVCKPRQAKHASSV